MPIFEVIRSYDAHPSKGTFHAIMFAVDLFANICYNLYSNDNMTNKIERRNRDGHTYHTPAAADKVAL